MTINAETAPFYVYCDACEKKCIGSHQCEALHRGSRSSQAKSYGTVFSLGNSIPEVAVILFLGVTTDGDVGRYPYKQVCRVLKGSG